MRRRHPVRRLWGLFLVLAGSLVALVTELMYTETGGQFEVQVILHAVWRTEIPAPEALFPSGAFIWPILVPARR